MISIGVTWFSCRFRQRTEVSASADEVFDSEPIGDVNSFRLRPTGKLFDLRRRSYYATGAVEDIQSSGTKTLVREIPRPSVPIQPSLAAFGCIADSRSVEKLKFGLPVKSLFTELLTDHNPIESG